jgi:hypothetical protein
MMGHNRNAEFKVKIVDSNGGNSIHTHSSVHSADGLLKGHKHCSNNSDWTLNDLLKNSENHSKLQTTTTLNTNNNNSNNNSNNNNNNNVSSNSNNDNVSSNNSNSNVISQATAAAGKKQIYNNNNKRPSNTNENSSKRAKSEFNGGTTTTTITVSRITKPQSPQLLQQLMAPSQQKSRTKDGQRWTSASANNTSTSNKTIPLQQSSNSVLMNLLMKEPLSIEPPEILLADSAPSPVVINDKMLSAAVDGHTSNPMISGGVGLRCKLQAPTAADFARAYHQCTGVSPSLLTPSDREIFKAIQHSVNERRSAGLRIDSDTIASILMELNENDYECNIPAPIENL